MPAPHGSDIERHAVTVLSDTAVPPGYPRVGRAWPTAQAVKWLRRAGWPLETITAALPQREHRGPRAGQATGDAAQPITVCPREWLEDLARRLGCDLADVCRGLIPDESA